MNTKPISVGLITEYNPFHNGHLYHIQKAKELTNATSVICVMSGDYVQRGEPAFIDKFTRTKLSIDNGINLLFELPVSFSLASAESFATGAVNILVEAKADYLVFGSECGDIDKLKLIAKTLVDESSEFKEALKENISSGLSFPHARQLAIEKILGKEYGDILSSPNNILGIEYIKAIIKGHFNIIPLTISRTGAGYNCEDITANIPSASAIRKYVKDEDLKLILSDGVPQNTKKALEFAKESHSYLELNDYTSLFRIRMRDIIYRCQCESNESTKDLFRKRLCEYEDMDEALANRLYLLYIEQLSHVSLEDLCEKLKTKQYTLSRIKRCIMKICLNIKNTTDNKTNYYLRILGFDKIGQEYLSYLKKNSEATIINKVADYKHLLYTDIYCSDIYRQLVYEKSGVLIESDYKKNIYIK